MISGLRAKLEAADRSYPLPWHLDTEPRAKNKLAIKGSIYTAVTVAKYYDGGSDCQEAALALIVAAVNHLADLLAVCEAAEAWSNAANSYGEDAYDESVALRVALAALKNEDE